MWIICRKLSKWKWSPWPNKCPSASQSSEHSGVVGRSSWKEFTTQAAEKLSCYFKCNGWSGLLWPWSTLIQETWGGLLPLTRSLSHCKWTARKLVLQQIWLTASTKWGKVGEAIYNFCWWERQDLKPQLHTIQLTNTDKILQALLSWNSQWSQWEQVRMAGSGPMKSGLGPT